MTTKKRKMMSRQQRKDDAVTTETVSVSTFKRPSGFAIRFGLRNEHIAKLGNPSHLGLRGNAANGFLLFPDEKRGNKLTAVGKSGNLFYLVTTMHDLDLSERIRKSVQLRPIPDKNSRIHLPPLPQAWIDCDPEFDGAGTEFEEGARTMAIGRAGDDAVRISAEVNPVADPVPVTIPVEQIKNGFDATIVPNGNGNGFHSQDLVLAKAGYPVLPQGNELDYLRYTLAVKLKEARDLVELIQQKSGMKCALDRNLRLVVSLPDIK